MKPYAERYEDFTKAIVKLAEKIHAANQSKFADTKYTLPEITLTLRNIYKNPVYHNRFVGSEMKDEKWSFGFCAMASLIIYEMMGGGDVWDLMAIRYQDWGIGSVIFLRDKATGENFYTTGEHFSVHVPYEIGVPLDTSKLKTPNKDKLKNILLFELNRRQNNNQKI